MVFAERIKISCIFAAVKRHIRYLFKNVQMENRVEKTPEMEKMVAEFTYYTITMENSGTCFRDVKYYESLGEMTDEWGRIVEELKLRYPKESVVVYPSDNVFMVVDGPNTVSVRWNVYKTTF